MALNYKSGDITKSDLTPASTLTTAALDVRGYSKVAVHTKFATCTGTSNTDVAFYLQTCNSTDGSWTDIVTIVDEASNNCEDLNGDVYFDYLPDATATALSGFGRYIRFRLKASGTFSVSYTVYWEAKE